jgi:hypothetical protein
MPDYVFSWMHRETNSVTHFLVKFAVHSECCSCFNKDNFPLSSKEVWLRDDYVP